MTTLARDKRRGPLIPGGRIPPFYNTKTGWGEKLTAVSIEALGERRLYENNPHGLAVDTLGEGLRIAVRTADHEYAAYLSVDDVVRLLDTLEPWWQNHPRVTCKIDWGLVAKRIEEDIANNVPSQPSGPETTVRQTSDAV